MPKYSNSYNIDTVKYQIVLHIFKIQSRLKKHSLKSDALAKKLSWRCIFCSVFS